MVAYNFERGFVPKILSDEKTHTIRRQARCKVGDLLQLYTGQRTNHCEKFAEAVCTDVSPVVIYANGMAVKGKILTLEEDTDLARKDGFEGFIAMANWFEQKYGTLPFSGDMISFKRKVQK